jgi:hypothetical protein
MLASTLIRIRHGEPDAVNSIAPAVPREIVWIIARCMRKEARRRLPICLFARRRLLIHRGTPILLWF